MTVKSFAAKSQIDARKIDGALLTLEKGLRFGKALVAYSGGKDGLCAAILAKKLGVNLGVCELAFTFSEQQSDIRRTAGKLNIEIVWRRTLDETHLVRHPRAVFPYHDNVAFSDLCQARQRNSVENWAIEHGYKVCITGRKKAGNSVRFAVHPRGNGTVGCHPLREWDDGDVWAFLRDNGIARPWIYDTGEFGQSEGNSPWNLFRRYADLSKNYAVIHAIEPALIERAAYYGVVGAREFLDSR